MTSNSKTFSKNTTRFVAVVMAGGPGTRFWPLSRFSKPKQLLNIVGKGSLLSQTIERLQPLFSPKDIFIITNVAQVSKLSQELMLPSSNIIEEPLSRDTAACVGLSALTLEKDGDDPVFCVLPADHYIEPKERFQKALSAGYKFACDGLIVTIGIKPSYPSTHLGYLQKGSTLDKIDGINVYQLRKFCEKPTEKSATRFISTKEYFWNSGIFMWKASTILSAIRRFMPDMQGGLMKIKESLDSPSYNQILKDEYEKFRRISIDFGVMEKIDNGVIVEGDFQWDDLGSFLSMAKYREKDSDGNVIEGLVCRINTKDSIVISESDHLLATLGIKDMIVVHTKDATLICPKEKIGAIKSIIEKIEAEGLKRFL